MVVHYAKVIGSNKLQGNTVCGKSKNSDFITYHIPSITCKECRKIVLRERKAKYGYEKLPKPK